MLKSPLTILAALVLTTYAYTFQPAKLQHDISIFYLRLSVFDKTETQQQRKQAYMDKAQNGESIGLDRQYIDVVTDADNTVVAYIQRSENTQINPYDIRIRGVFINGLVLRDPTSLEIQDFTLNHFFAAHGKPIICQIRSLEVTTNIDPSEILERPLSECNVVAVDSYIYLHPKGSAPIMFKGYSNLSSYLYPGGTRFVDIDSDDARLFTVRDYTPADYDALRGLARYTSPARLGVQEQDRLWGSFLQEYDLSNFHLVERRDGRILAALSLPPFPETLHSNRAFPNIQFFVSPSFVSYLTIARLLDSMLRYLAAKGIIHPQRDSHNIRSNKIIQNKDEHRRQLDFYERAPVGGISISSSEDDILEFTTIKLE